MNRLRLSRGRETGPGSAPRLTSERVWTTLEKAPTSHRLLPARAMVHPAGSVSIESVSKRPASLVPRERRSGCLLELVPFGSFLTYGLGVSLKDMTKPARALAHVRVS